MVVYATTLLWIPLDLINDKWYNLNTIKSSQKEYVVLKTSLTYKVASVMGRLGMKPDPNGDPHVAALRQDIKDLNGIEFAISHFPNGEWVAKSTNIDGILTGGDAADNVDEMIKDAILTYYDIAPAYCDAVEVHLSNNKEVVRQEVVVTA